MNRYRNKTITFRVSEEDFRKIQLYCVENSTTVSTLLRDYITKKCR